MTRFAATDLPAFSDITFIYDLITILTWMVSYKITSAKSDKLLLLHSDSEVITVSGEICAASDEIACGDLRTEGE